MRLKDYDSRDGKRVWLSEQEIQHLIDNVDNNHVEAEMAVTLMARCGLRRREVTGDDEHHGIRFVDVIETEIGDTVRVWEGKGDKYREVPAPSDFRMQAQTYRQAMGREPDDELVDADPSTLYDWVQRARGRCRAQSGDEGWQYVGPHDLRRSWGVRLLEAGVMPSVVMDWGGWEDWETFRNHYLAEFSPEALRRERGKVGWLNGNRAVEEGQQSYAAVRGQESRRYEQ
jgi:integrase